MEVGDRVRVARVDDYTAMVLKSTNTPSPVGKTGVVRDKQYNPNMARYGMGNEVYVRMDGEDCDSIWIEEHLVLV